ncbi:hypothetical protein [Flexibacterium corallicola]|uniref:hypothetical protein n=1 Tax=Flexibacterium corallicola TaxID=3037259 RepID=UPI00286F049C|nr:hypothetical protein [Pseudovibrio sp. M1P-2-3]
MKNIHIIKSIGRPEAILFWGTFAASILLHMALGGVVVGQKYEHGKYLISLRETPSTWMEITAFVYYAKLAQPWILLSVAAFIILLLIMKAKS